MQAERHHYSQFITEDFDTYIARKAMNGVHGNNTELQVLLSIIYFLFFYLFFKMIFFKKKTKAIGEMYNRPVEVYSDDNGGAKINLFHDEVQKETCFYFSKIDLNFNSIVCE